MGVASTDAIQSGVLHHTVEESCGIELHVARAYNDILL